MKKCKFLLAFFMVFIIFLSTSNVYASDNVKIKSVELVDKSVNTTEVSKATFDGLVMNFDLKFMSLNDYAKYKVVVENKENKDFKISIDSNFGNSKYISYDYVKADSLKANSDSEFYVTVSYKNKVSDSDFSNGKYNEKNRAVLKLSTDSVSNPLTSNDMIMIIIGLLVVSVILFVLFKNKKNKKVNALVLLSLLSIPLFVNAVDSLKITINSNVVIEEKYSVGYEVHGYIKASDISDFDLSYADLLTTIYSGSVSEENKYFLYSGVIYREKKLYDFGETTTFDIDSVPIYKFYANECHVADDDVSTYEMLPPSGSICGTPIESKISNIYYYHYAKDDLTRFGYKYNDDDNTFMQFSNAEDHWDEKSSVYVFQGSTFIMPNHDVLFTLR